MIRLTSISLRIRIFLSMILLVLLTSILILVVTVYQYDEQTKDYNIQRFERKEVIAKKTIELELTNKTTKTIKHVIKKRKFDLISYRLTPTTTP